jgi:hypothetical protein
MAGDIASKGVCEGEYTTSGRWPERKTVLEKGYVCIDVKTLLALKNTF